MLVNSRSKIQGSTPVTYYFLYLLEPTEPYREKFGDLSNVVRNRTENLKRIFNLDIDGEQVSDPEKWCKLTGVIEIPNHDNNEDDEKEKADIEVKYYKERIIIKVKTRCEGKDLNKLFKQAKSKREILLKNDLVSLTNIQNKLRKLCIDDRGRKCIQSVYQYPLIEVEKEYERLDFDLEDEAITTFFYEIPDVGDINRLFLIFPVKYKKVLMRVSGPSVVTTKMSGIMRAKLINLLYESALYKMRESERKCNYCKECKNIFGSNYEYLRKYIAAIFFSIESGSSGIETGSSFQILSFISAFGALAAILGISYAVFHILPFSLEVLKTSLSILLFSLTISMLVSIIGIDYLRRKSLKSVSKIITGITGFWNSAKIKVHKYK